MVTQRHSTSAYTAEDRERLGRAVAAARLKAGFSSRGAFAAECGVSLRSIDKVENGHAGAGKRTLFAIGRVLPGWTEDTAIEILEGAAVPAADDESPDAESFQQVMTASVDDPEFWHALRKEVQEWQYDELWALYQSKKQRRTHPE